MAEPPPGAEAIQWPPSGERQKLGPGPGEGGTRGPSHSLHGGRIRANGKKKKRRKEEKKEKKE